MLINVRVSLATNAYGVVPLATDFVWVFASKFLRTHHDKSGVMFRSLWLTVKFCHAKVTQKPGWNEGIPANHPLSDSPCFIVNKFEHFEEDGEGSLYSEVPWWCLGWGPMYGEIQCIMRNTHMGTPHPQSTEWQIHTAKSISFSQLLWPAGGNNWSQNFKKKQQKKNQQKKTKQKVNYLGNHIMFSHKWNTCLFCRMTWGWGKWSRLISLRDPASSLPSPASLFFVVIVIGIIVLRKRTQRVPVSHGFVEVCTC